MVLNFVKAFVEFVLMTGFILLVGWLAIKAGLPEDGVVSYLGSFMWPVFLGTIIQKYFPSASLF